MTAILVVCTGNICRSPIAQGFLRDALIARFGDEAPSVTSAGTAGLDGSRAMADSITAAAERGSDIGAHLARRIEPGMVTAESADLVLCMAGDHREEIERLLPDAAGRTFTLKELVRLLESLPAAGEGTGPDSLPARIAEADAARRAGFEGLPLDEDISDPLNMPITAYRAIAWELDEWTDRLVEGLFGPGAGRPYAQPAAPRMKEGG